MKPVRIIAEPYPGRCRVEMEDGTPLPMVTRVSVDIEACDVPRAEVSLHIGGCDITAHPLLSLASLREAAEAHGFDLISKGGADG